MSSVQLLGKGKPRGVNPGGRHDDGCSASQQLPGCRTSDRIRGHARHHGNLTLKFARRGIARSRGDLHEARVGPARVLPLGLTRHFLTNPVEVCFHGVPGGDPSHVLAGRCPAIAEPYGAPRVEARRDELLPAAAEFGRHRLAKRKLRAVVLRIHGFWGPAQLSQ